MQNRILDFLKAENISQSQFADEIGVARASVSHIISGRNKPGCDFIARMISHYPRLNLDWLLIGSGSMYKMKTSDISVQTPAPAPDNTEEIPQLKLEAIKAEPEITTIPQGDTSSGKRPKITKVIAFFSDGTFEELPR